MKWFKTICVASLALMFSPSMAAAVPNAVKIDVEVGDPLLPPNRVNTTFVRVALEGIDIPRSGERTPVNVAIVLDRSGSMNGEKMRRAREAAEVAVDYLSNDDIVSVLAYDDVVEVVIPATKASDKQRIKRAIRNIDSDGSTALFAGVSKGAQEVRKFFERNYVNRVILLSDGQANVGPSTPAELGSLGASLGKEGMTVTTIGLGAGYDEDLMTRLAGYSDGNHYFVESPRQLASIFDKEFGDVLSVVAQDVDVEIECADGVKPLRLLGREGEIIGQKVTSRLSQVYSEQQKYLLLEVEVPMGKHMQRKDIAQVSVRYNNIVAKRDERRSAKAAVQYERSGSKIEAAKNKPVIESAVVQQANEISKDALRLRDQGKKAEAKTRLEQAAGYVRSNAAYFSAPSVAADLEAEFEEDADEVEDDGLWQTKRKELKSKQYRYDKQQKK